MSASAVRRKDLHEAPGRFCVSLAGFCNRWCHQALCFWLIQIAQYDIDAQASRERVNNSHASEVVSWELHPGAHILIIIFLVLRLR